MPNLFCVLAAGVWVGASLELLLAHNRALCDDHHSVFQAAACIIVNMDLCLFDKTVHALPASCIQLVSVYVTQPLEAHAGCWLF